MTTSDEIVVDIKIARNPERPDVPNTYSGWIVPGTDDLLAIDERYAASAYRPARWFITHLPTGRKVPMPPALDDPPTREAAVLIAQAFYDEAMKMGWPLSSSDASAIAERHNEMLSELRVSFWCRVLESQEAARIEHAEEIHP